MPIFPIRTFPDPVLGMKASAVTDFDQDLRRLVDDMLDTMYQAPGVGLAAPQIGVSKQIFVADIGEGPFVMVNPEITASSGKWKFEEGCLSIPGKYWHIKRPESARAEGVDLDGRFIAFEGDDLLGRVLQHEIDHLDGLLLLSHLSSRVRRQVLRELREESLGIEQAR
jgi:peptide deformylase